eukprot:TRINITY_DN3693_c0_g1_i3.p1 TRINITY_DN3693_c0_g1~~TRINITY_DN3693_c0_g1_i3.p1  ORF type:complete len:251 (-),score=18.20 TRINITY_DN3693_c0_g1_i3:225-872(-)
MWEVATGYCVRTLEGHENWVRQMSLSPDGLVLASVSSDQSVRLWGLKNFTCLQVLRDHDHVVECVAFSNAAADKFLNQIPRTLEGDSKSETTDGSMSAPATPVLAANSPGGAYVASGSRDKSIKIFHVESGSCVLTLSGHDNWVRSVMFHPCGKYILSCGDDKTIRVWDLSKGGRMHRKIENAHDLFVTSIDYSRTLPALASGGLDNVLRIWECR